MANKLAVQGTTRATLLPTTTLAVDVTAGVTTPVTGLPAASYVAATCVFVRAGGGTTCKVWVQTSLDEGASWHDIMSFAFTTSSLTKMSCVSTGVAVAATVTTTDGALTDNTILNGFIGERFRVKYTTVGTYTGASSLRVDIVTKG